jgi:hypothetical protein
MNENLIGVREASRILGITVPTVHHHITHANLKTIGRFGNSLILDRQTVEDFRADRARRGR